jgi:hypothetical protein
VLPEGLSANVYDGQLRVIFVPGMDVGLLSTSLARNEAYVRPNYSDRERIAR